MPPKKKNVPVRKRLKHIKRHVKKPATDQSEQLLNIVEADTNEAPVTVPNSTEKNEPEVIASPAPLDHDYVRRPSSSMSELSISITSTDFSEDATLSDASVTSSGFLSPASSTCSSPWPPPPPPTPPKTTQPQPKPQLPPQVLRCLLLSVRDKLRLMLPDLCLPVVDNSGVHVLMVGRRETKAVQREVFVSSSGAVRIQVHGQDYPAHSVLGGVLDQKPLYEEEVGYFTDRIIQIVSNIRLLDICAGMDQSVYKDAWSIPNGAVETDIFKECRYKETFRSKKCSLLVPVAKWRCKECAKLLPLLKRKIQSMQCEDPHPATNTRYLSGKQKDDRIVEYQKTIRMKTQTVDRLQMKMKEMIAKDGVSVDQDQSNDLQEILQSANLSREHSLFLQQQMKAAQCKKSCGMRWHPTLIRMALSLYLKAPGPYKQLCESGFIKLPTSRTLFDYSHVTNIESGIDKTVLESVAKRVSSDEPCNQYYVVMADEMHISKNLVVLKSNGNLIGFKDLDDLDQDVAALQSHLDDPDKPLEQEMATKVMSFMIRGISSTVKDVVASYPVCNPSPKQMYMWTWEIIGSLERSGVKVIAFTCDGCPSNRAFIKLHKPATVTVSGVIFDTVNKFAPDRILFFFSDVPHLLKTIRNAFYNSRKNNKKATRLLKKNNQLIVWDTIIRLFTAKKSKNLRKSCKLNAQNVYPDSYSRMKVKPAAEIMSHTVATDLLSQGWSGTSETVDFILKVNNWFDLLNGAYALHGRKTNNKRLEPYTSKDVEDFEKNVPDNRFEELLDFLQYLEEWKNEVESRKNASMCTSVMDDLGVQPLPDEGSFHALDDSHVGAEENEEDFSKSLLPHQTRLGIEMSTRAFIGAISFLIKEGVKFINARVFCQDPLEQNFGKQRMAGGGSSNPNFSQYLHKQRGIHTIGELSASNKKGNTEVLQEAVDMSSEPLPKRRKFKKDNTDATD